jgi:hypothetical protein
MKITIISITFFLISALSIWQIFLRIKKNQIGVRSALIWIGLWAGIGFFSLFPELLDTAVRLVQMKTRILFMLLVSVFVLFALVFNYASRMDNMQRNITKLTREIATLNFKLEKKNKTDKDLNLKD